LSGESSARAEEGFYSQIHESQRALILKLERSLITPLDAEDMHWLSAHLRRVIHLQAIIAKSAKILKAVPFEPPYPDFATSSVLCAEGAVRAVGALPASDALLTHTAQLVKDAREGGKSIRAWRTTLISAQPVPVVLRAFEFLRMPEELFRQYQR